MELLKNICILVKKLKNMENWKEIEGYTDYMVSNLGRVKSLKFSKEKILKSSKLNNGYLFVNLCKDGKYKPYLIHRLVAQAFLPNPDNLPQVNHRNENKTDNRVENLEYCNSQYNNNYGTRNERVIKSLSIPILQFNLDGELVRKWNSITQVERELGFDKGNISRSCKQQYGFKSAYGYKWCYHYKSLWLKNHVPLVKQKKVA